MRVTLSFNPSAWGRAIPIPATFDFVARRINDVVGDHAPVTASQIRNIHQANDYQTDVPHKFAELDLPDTDAIMFKMAYADDFFTIELSEVEA